MRKITQEEWINKASQKHNHFYDYSKVTYVNSQSKVCIICPIHGEFMQIANGHMQGQGCPICAKYSRISKNTNTTEKFILKAQMIHGNKYDYSKVNYVDQYTPVTIICPEHGEFQQVPKYHLRKDRPSGCPKCKLKQQTLLYDKICKVFPKLDIKFEYSPEWLGLQRFDIFIEKYNIAIEYNGKQHYMPIKFFGGELTFKNIQERDNFKKNKCKSNGCTLFELPYNYKENDFQDLINSINLIINNYENQQN